jgi:hypothetical protein
VSDLWSMADLVERYHDYASRADAAMLHKTRTVARLGMMACAAAKTAVDIGPRFVIMPTDWQWPSARDGE